MAINPLPPGLHPQTVRPAQPATPQAPITTGDQFTPSPPPDFRPPSRFEVMQAGAGRVLDSGGQFARGLGDQVVDVWEALRHPVETYEALRGLGQRVIEDPRGAARSAWQAGGQLVEDVQTNSAEQNARLAGQNAPIPGLRQAAALGAMVRLQRTARVLGNAPNSPVQRQLGRMPEHPDPLRHLGPEAPVPPLQIGANSQALTRRLTPQERRLLDAPSNQLDNARAFSTDFAARGVHVKPAVGEDHIHMRFENGELRVFSPDGATREQVAAARLRLLSDGQYRQTMAGQIRSGLTEKPPTDPAALRQAQDFLRYLETLPPG